MPKIYRVMEESNGKPSVGNRFGQLGVRAGNIDSTNDITPDLQGDVHPGKEGMSVNPNIASMPPRLIPKRLKKEFPDARGKDSGIVWSHGEGPFRQDTISEELSLEPDSPSHGVVAPKRTMPLTDYQRALAATVNGWKREK